METSKTQELLAKANLCQMEIDLCDRRIEYLTTVVTVLLNDPTIPFVDMILCTRPRSGARPIVVPLYPIANSQQMMEYFANDTPIPPNSKQIGFQRLFQPDELKDTDNLLTVEVSLEPKLCIAVIEQTMVRLKQRRQTLLIDIEEIFKK
jgi:hypothetical protein